MTNEPRGCLAFLFGFGSKPSPSAGEEGNYHSGPGGYEDGSYHGGYAADFRTEYANFDEDNEQ